MVLHNEIITEKCKTSKLFRVLTWAHEWYVGLLTGLYQVQFSVESTISVTDSWNTYYIMFTDGRAVSTLLISIKSPDAVSTQILVNNKFIIWGKKLTSWTWEFCLDVPQNYCYSQDQI